MFDVSERLSEEVVSERLISTFKLIRPLFYYNTESVSVVEIPEPKLGSQYEEGYDHVEFVIDDLHEFVLQNRDVPFITKHIDRKRNPEIKIRLGRKSIKFHTISLEKIIELEKQGLM